MLNYLAKFLPCHSEVSGLLRELLKPDQTWSWTSTHEAAFVSLRNSITKAPVLAFYSPSASTIVSADASSYGIDEVLLQVQPDGRRAPVGYASRALSDAEKR